MPRETIAVIQDYIFTSDKINLVCYGIIPYLPLLYKEANMPNVFEDPADYGLELLASLSEIHNYSSDPIGAPSFSYWTFAVWRETDGVSLYPLRYGFESRSTFSTRQPFARISRMGQLKSLVTKSDWDLFRLNLNDFWSSPHALNRRFTAQECRYRNARRRLQRRVGHEFFENITELENYGVDTNKL